MLDNLTLLTIALPAAALAVVFLTKWLSRSLRIEDVDLASVDSDSREVIETEQAASRLELELAIAEELAVSPETLNALQTEASKAREVADITRINHERRTQLEGAKVASSDPVCIPAREYRQPARSEKRASTKRSIS